MRYKEIETKYDAKNIKLSKFEEFCQQLGNFKYKMAAGYDHFYSKVSDKKAFCRHRVGADSNQLTFKRKLSKANNYIRTEHNIDLVKKMTEESLKAFLDELQYKYRRSLYKNCFIYKYDYYTLVYYIVYDTDMEELGRFIEIEMDEDFEWSNDKEAWNSLVIIEKLCGPLGLDPTKRISDSLYELYVQESS